MRARWTVITLFALAAAGLAAPAFAQDIRGLTLRATDKFAALSSGTVDLVKQPEGAGYLVKVDLSKASDGLKGGDLKDAKAFVVWAVDMDGTRHNLGKLSDKGVIENAKTDFVVAKLFVTPESDATAAQPAGSRIYELTLRSVTETDKAPAAAAKAEAASGSTGAGGSTTTTAASTSKTDASPSTSASSPSASSATTGSAATASTAASTADKSHPQTLPTTGNMWQDLSVLAVVALLLVAGGWRLARIRA